MKIYIYQIFYNEETQKKILPGFIPLDNIKNLRPDWFEFWVIFNYLKNNELKNDSWYGFLSPRFLEKTGYDSQFCLNILEKFGHTADVAIFSLGWDQSAYFLNPFEQGEIWHPGLLKTSQDFFKTINSQIDLEKLVSDTNTTVFSNYLIAKKNFWEEWFELAKKFFDYSESHLKNTLVNYGAIEHQYPMKTFIQERLASFILMTKTFKVIALDRSFDCPIFEKLFDKDIKTRKLLQACDLMKTKYREKRDQNYLDMYWKIRSEIKLKKPY